MTTNQAKSITEAPTSGSTQTAVGQLVSSGLNLEELDFCTAVEMYYLEGNGILDETAALERFGIKPSDYHKYISTSKIATFLDERGLNFSRHFKRLSSIDESIEASGIDSGLLSPVQLMVANSVLDLTDQRSLKKKLQDLGISTRQWEAWYSDKNFAEYIQKRAQSIVDVRVVASANMALMDKVEQGDMSAIKFAMQYKDHFDPDAKNRLAAMENSASNNAANIAAVNFHSMMVKIVEIINEECEGQTAIRIADRFKQLLSAANLATNLLEVGDEEEIIIPEIKAARVMTPALQALMDKTGGNT